MSDCEIYFKMLVSRDLLRVLGTNSKKAFWADLWSPVRYGAGLCGMGQRTLNLFKEMILSTFLRLVLRGLGIIYKTP